MHKEEIIKLILKYSDVLEEIWWYIEEVDKLYCLKTQNKVFKFSSLSDLEKLLILYNKKYILTRWMVFN